MASRYAVATGNWSSTATWDGGTLPQPGDDVRSNGFTVTIDQNVDVASIQNTALSPAVAGGSFVVTTSGYTIQANVISIASCLIYNAAITLTLIGDCTPLSSGAAVSSNNTSSILYLTGNLYGNNTGFGGNGVSTRGSIIMVGDCIGSSNNNGALSLTNAASNAQITGNVLGGLGGQGRGIDAVNGSTIVINGNVIGGVGNGISQSGAAYNLTLNGNAIGGNNGNAILITGGSITGSYTLYGSSSGRGSALNNINPTTSMSVSDVVFGANGSSPLSGQIKFASSGVTINVLKDDSTTVNLIDVANADYPIESDVRFGTSYGATLYTGTLAVPPAGSVSLGVPVDNTTGTGSVSSAEIRDLILPSILSAITQP